MGYNIIQIYHIKVKLYSMAYLLSSVLVIFTALTKIRNGFELNCPFKFFKILPDSHLVSLEIL